MINRTRDLRVGDILLHCGGVIDPAAWIIRARQWGLSCMFDRSLAVHVSIVVDRNGDDRPLPLYYACEMTATGGPNMRELNDWKDIARIGRHGIFNSTAARIGANRYMIEKHAFKVHYGYETLLKDIGIPVKDNPYTQICTQWVCEVLHFAGAILPDSWCEADGSYDKVMPKDFQTWPALTWI